MSLLTMVMSSGRPLVSLLVMGLLAADTSSGSDTGGRRWKRDEDPELGARPCQCLYYIYHHS